MGGPLSTNAQNKSLANDYGASKGPNAAAAHYLALFTSDPATGGTELTSAGGYARVTMTNNGTTWPSAPTGGSITSAQFAFPTSTGAWSGVATHFLLIDSATGDWWDYGPLDASVSVDQAGVIVQRTVTVFYNQAF